jgi:hypothetical protein
MSENHQFNEDKPQLNVDKRRCGLDLFGSLGEGMFAKENIETLRDSQGLTPLHPVSNILKNNIKSILANERFQATESTETLGLFSGSSAPPGLFDEIHKKNMKSDYSGEGLSTTDGTDILGNSSGLTPLHSGIEILKSRVIK